MKKLKLNGKNELTKDEMKKINGGLYGCIVHYTAAYGGGAQMIICNDGANVDPYQCYYQAYMDCYNNSSICSYVEC